MKVPTEAQQKAMSDICKLTNRVAMPDFNRHVHSVLFAAMRTSGTSIDFEAQVELWRKSDPHWFRKRANGR
jgi:hypothetical protein